MNREQKEKLGKDLDLIGELLVERKKLASHLDAEGVEYSKVDFHRWPNPEELSWVVEVVDEEKRQQVLNAVERWRGMPVIPYLPVEMHELRMLRYHALEVVKLLQSSNVEKQKRGMDRLITWANH